LAYPRVAAGVRFWERMGAAKYVQVWSDTVSVATRNHVTSAYVTYCSGPVPTVAVFRTKRLTSLDLSVNEHQAAPMADGHSFLR
jgi:hypothetical protein